MIVDPKLAVKHEAMGNRWCFRTRAEMQAAAREEACLPGDQIRLCGRHCTIWNVHLDNVRWQALVYNGHDNPCGGAVLGSNGAAMLPSKVVPCPHCHKPLSAERIHRRAKYCSKACERAFRRTVYRRRHPRPVIASGSVGAIGELRVAADLLSRNLAVFRSLSPACCCDLVVLKDGTLFRVEVTTGTYLKGGGVSSPPHDAARYDILAVVCHDKIHYTPELPA